MVTLPFFSFLLSLLYFLFNKQGYRQASIRAALVLGMTVWTSTEALSPFERLTLPALALVWGISATFWGILCCRSRIRIKLPEIAREDHFILGSLGFILLVTFAIALAAAPNNMDSMAYHMGRVVHWMENRSVAHFPTNIGRQLYFSPWAEFAILHLQILAHGSDRFVNLVQWFAFFGSMISVSLIAQSLGLPRRGQALAALIVGATPMLILQSTSTQNDLVCAFWTATALVFLTDRELLFGALALGLAYHTKSTSLLIAAPFLAFLGWRELQAYGMKKVLLWCAMLGLFGLGLSLPHFYRNARVYGHPLGDPFTISSIANTSHGVRPLISNLIRNAGLHLGGPIHSRYNEYLDTAIRGLHRRLGWNESEPTTSFTTFSVVPMSKHEDDAGNPIQFFLFFVAAFYLLAQKKADPGIRKYALSLLGGFVIFSLMLKWQPWGTRLQSPWFVLGAPLGALFLGQKTFSSRMHRIVVLVLFASSLPWVLLNDTRELFNRSRGRDSVFLAERTKQYFANKQGLYVPSQEAIREIAKTGCQIVAMRLVGDGWEYPFWQLAYAEGLRISFQHFEIGDGSKILADRLARPCLILNQDQVDVTGLEERLHADKIWQNGPVSLFRPRG